MAVQESWWHMDLIADHVQGCTVPGPEVRDVHLGLEPSLEEAT